MTTLEQAKEIAKALNGKKAVNIKVIKIEDVSILSDYFVIATGTSSTHVKALADEVEYQLNEIGYSVSHVEGYRSNSWILLDFVDVIVHVFSDEAREYYDLERLWKDGEEVDISAILKD
ncbi:MAG: ribosome silencing factor [Bacillota bacterium]|nr:ribosome silencing factor [Bacillota bacterium]